MIIGVPREIKSNETRVAMVPAGVRALGEKGHEVIVEKSAGERIGISDGDYVAAGARIVDRAEDVFAAAEMVVKVKEPLAQEYGLLREGQILFTYLHLAPAPELTRVLLERKVIGIAYETVQLDNGSLPLLTPMSEIAGRMSIQIGSYYLETRNGGRGILLGGVPGTRPGNVVVIGGGVVGLNAAKIALGMGANVVILDVNIDRLRYLDDILKGRVVVLASNVGNIEGALSEADLVVGAVLVPGARAPRLVTRDMIGKMKPGSVVVDVAIDQGGCVETAVPTTYDKPVFTVDGVIHCCVANLPGAVGRTATFALTNATLPYVVKIADMGYRQALSSDGALAKGLNVVDGKLVHRAVAQSLGMEYSPYEMGS